MFARDSNDWGKYVGVLQGFFDESGKGHQHPVVSFSGFVARRADWPHFDNKWERALHRHSIDAFHFNRHSKDAPMVRDFINVMKRHGDTAISMSVDVAGFSELPEKMRLEYCGKAPGNPHYLAFKSVVLYLVGQLRPGDSIAFTCDEDEETNKHCFEWYKQLKRTEPNTKGRLISFCIADDEAYFPLQAADLLAGICRTKAESEITGNVNPYGEYFANLIAPQSKSYLKIRSGLLNRKELHRFGGDWKALVDGIDKLGTTE